MQLLEMIAWMGVTPALRVVKLCPQFSDQIINRPAAREFGGINVALDQRHAIGFMIVVDLDGHGQVR